MLEFENYKELKKVIQDSKETKAPALSVFQSFTRMFLFLIFYGIIIVVVTLVMYRFLDKSARIIKVPSVINKNFLDGYMVLKKLNLNVDVTLQDYSDVPHGVITSQSISPNSQVKEHRKIVLTVSSGHKISETDGTDQGDSGGDVRSMYLTIPIPSDLSQYIKNPDDDEVQVKVYVTDSGEYKNSLVESRKAKAGDTIKVQLNVTGKIKEKVYLNGILYLEKEYE